MLTVAKVDRYDLINTPNSDKPSMTIWFSGCSRHCEGCYNEKLWDSSAGTGYTVEEIVNMVCTQCEKTDVVDIVLLGGEPMEQDATSIVKLVSDLDGLGYHIWMYTSWDLDDIPNNIKNHLYTIKCGAYDDSLKCDGAPSSTNQKFYRNNTDDGSNWWKEISFREDNL